MLSFHWPMIVSGCPIEQIKQYLLLVQQNKVHNCWCWPQNPFKPPWKNYLNLSERERESNKIPWLRGSCGILVLTESSSRLHSAVCFGHLSEVEICSSFPPTALSQQQTTPCGTLKRTARQPLHHFRERRLALQRRVFTDTLLAWIWFDSKPITRGE